MIRSLDKFRRLRWWRNGHAVPGEPPTELETADSNGHAHDSAGSDQAHPAPPEPPWLAQLDRAEIPRTLVYPSTTLGRLLDQSADRFGNAPAVVYGATRWNYRELLAQVNRTA